MSQIHEFTTAYLSRIPGNIRWVDIVEILIITFLFYHILVWIKNTRAWSLLKGIIVIVVFIMIAAMPCHAQTAILAQFYDVEGEYASNLVSLSTLLSLITIPVFAAILL